MAPAPQRPRRPPSNCAGHAIRQATALGAQAREPTKWPHACDRRRATHRAPPACPPSYADYILRLQDTKLESLEINAAPSARRITTRRRFASARRSGGERHSVCGAIHASVRGAISARVPPSSPSRHARSTHNSTLISARTTPKRTHHHARAAALERGQDDPPRDQLCHQPLRAPGTSTRRCARPSRQPPLQRAQLSVGPAAARAQLSVGPAAARATCAHAAGAHAHARRPFPRLPQLRARREARRPPRDSTCARHQHVRMRRLACFADGLRVAPPVQAAAAASGRARRPPRPRHLRHDRQARRRHHGHKMIRPPSRPRSPAWPRRREACACEACACEPGAVVLEAAAPSANCSSRSPSSAAPSASA